MFVCNAGVIDENQPLPVGANVMAAALAGAAATISTNPLWVVKIRLQVCLLKLPDFGFGFFDI